MKQPLYAFDCSVILPAGEHVYRRGESSMIKLDSGNVFFAYTNHFHRSESTLTPIEGDNAIANVCAIQLSPEGSIVAEERELVPCPEGVLNVMSPAVRRLPDGRIGMLYSYRKSQREASRLFITSEDKEARIWSEPVTVASGGYVTGCHDRFTVLKSGRLIAPLNCTEDWDWHFLHVRVAYSDDLGATWQLSQAVRLPFVGEKYGWRGGFIESGCVEASVVEREDSTLLMCLRTAMGTLFASQSVDGGETWSSPYSMEVISPQAPAHLSRLSSTGDMLLIWTASYDLSRSLSGGRHLLMAAISTDGGKNWPHNQRKVLVGDWTRSVDYPAVMEYDDTIWLTFRQSTTPEVCGGPTSSLLMRFPVEWLYDKTI